MKVRKSRDIEAYIPTSSMADIAFLLIIFFMVTSVFPLDKTTVELAETAEVYPYPEDSMVIVITTEKLLEAREGTGDIEWNSIGAPGDRIVVKVSTGGSEESEPLTDGSKGKQQFGFAVQQGETISQPDREALQKQLQEDVIEAQARISKASEDSAGDSGGYNVVVVKADKKVPYFAVDTVIRAIQEMISSPELDQKQKAIAKNVAVLTRLPG